MRNRRRTPNKLLATVVAAAAFCSPVGSDSRIAKGSSADKKICYCECEAQAGARLCTHMCELPKYENRPWATSCHKGQDSGPPEGSGAPGARSTKNNHIQQTRR